VGEETKSKNFLCVIRKSAVIGRHVRRCKRTLIQLVDTHYVYENTKAFIPTQLDVRGEEFALQVMKLTSCIEVVYGYTIEERAGEWPYYCASEPDSSHDCSA
jgi:hypothetical protein